jgi:hypothetical protein
MINNAFKAFASRIVIYILFVGVIYYIWIALVVFNSGIPFDDMDWNGDNFVSIGEFFVSSDIGVRATSARNDCVEYFYLKDGMTLKIVCN